MIYRCNYGVLKTNRNNPEFNISEIYLEVEGNYLMCVSVKTNKEFKYMGILNVTLCESYEALTRFVISQQIVWDKLREVLEGYLGIDEKIKSPFTRFNINLPWKNNLKFRVRKELDKLNREMNIRKNKYTIEGGEW